MQCTTPYYSVHPVTLDADTQCDRCDQQATHLWSGSLPIQRQQSLAYKPGWRFLLCDDCAETASSLMLPLLTSAETNHD